MAKVKARVARHKGGLSSIDLNCYFALASITQHSRLPKAVNPARAAVQ